MNLNIVLHGLMFMELNRTSGFLEIYAPFMQKHPHRFKGGSRGNLVTLNGPIDWTTDGKLKGKQSPPDPINDVSPNILQFSKNPKETAIGDFNPKDAQRLITLPWPIRFSAYRLASIGSFTPLPGGIGQNILKWCKRKANTTIGLVTVLTYTYDIMGLPIPGLTHSLTLHFFHNGNVHASISDVNDDLADAAAAFKNSASFDLKLDPAGNYPNLPLDPPDILPAGVTPEDELSLDEPLTALDGALKDFFLAVGKIKKPDQKDFRSLADGWAAMLNPANCPLFYVHDQTLP